MKAFWKKYGLRLLLAVTAAALCLSALSYLGSTTSLLHNALGVLSSPFRRAANGIVTWVGDKQQYYKDSTALAEENEQLRIRVAELERQARQAYADSEENALLRELLGLRERRRDLQFESAMVIERQVTNWSSTLTLNRGTGHGIEIGQCVISAEGNLVGVISDAGLNWSTVLTTVDTDTEIGARVFRTGEICVAEGDLALMDDGSLRLSYLSGDSDVMSGDFIVTSGLGGFYPSNLGIGSVRSIRTGDDGVSKYAVLTPAVDFDALTEVFAVTAFDTVD